MKNKIRKHVYMGIIFAGLSLITACSDFLEREPLGRLTQDDLTSGSYESQVFGL